MRSEAVTRLDGALVRLRRLWSGPAQPIGSGDRPVDMSSLLLLEGCARLAETEGGPVGVGALTGFAGVRPSTATRHIDRAVAAGLLLRDDDAGDARRRTVRATAEGAAVRERAVRLRTDWLRGVLTDWQEDDVERFAELLDRFAEQVRRSGGPDAASGSGTPTG